MLSAALLLPALSLLAPAVSAANDKRTTSGSTSNPDLGFQTYYGELPLSLLAFNYSLPKKTGALKVFLLILLSSPSPPRSGHA